MILTLLFSDIPMELQTLELSKMHTPFGDIGGLPRSVYGPRADCPKIGHSAMKTVLS